MPRTKQSAAAVFVALILLLLLGYPFLSIFNKFAFMQGIPVLYIYIAVMWIAAIAFSFFNSLKTPAKKKKHE